MIKFKKVMSTQAKDSLKKSAIVNFFENFQKGKMYVINNHIYFSMRYTNNSNM